MYHTFTVKRIKYNSTFFLQSHCFVVRWKTETISSEKRYGSRKTTIVSPKEEAEISTWMTSVIKVTLTNNKEKKQRRVMLNSIRKLYQKFVVENPDINISKTSFLRCKPFRVTRPRDSDRETCVCKQHDNLQYIVDTMHK